MKKRIFSIMTAFALVAGAMTSCQKDWTEDINKLQSDVSALSTQVKSLQDLVNGGKVITGAVRNDQTGVVTINFSDGNKVELFDGKNGTNGADGKTHLIEIGKNGNWFIDGEDTGKPSQGAAGLNGTNGTNGANGANGENGKDADTIYFVPENGVWVKYVNDEKDETYVGESYYAGCTVVWNSTLGTLTVVDEEGVAHVVSGGVEIKSLAIVPEVIYNGDAYPTIDFYAIYKDAEYINSNEPFVTYRVNPTDANTTDVEWSFINRTVVTKVAGDDIDLLRIIGDPTGNAADGMKFKLGLNQNVPTNAAKKDLVALKATVSEDVAIVSDYAFVKQTNLKEFAIIDLEQYESTPKAIVKYRTSIPAIGSEDDFELPYYTTLDLEPHLATYANEVEKTLGEISVPHTHSVELYWDEADDEPTYLGADGVTNQQKFVSLDGYVLSVNKAFLTNKGRAAIGRTPLLVTKTIVKDAEGKDVVIAEAYIKIVIVKEATTTYPDLGDVEFDMTKVALKYTDIPATGYTTTLPWDVINAKVFEFLGANGLSYEEFVTKYDIDNANFDLILSNLEDPIEGIPADGVTANEGVIVKSNLGADLSTSTNIFEVTFTDQVNENCTGKVVSTIKAKNNKVDKNVIINLPFEVSHEHAWPNFNSTRIASESIKYPGRKVIEVMGKNVNGKWQLISDFEEHFEKYLDGYVSPADNHQSAIDFDLAITDPVQTGVEVCEDPENSKKAIRLTSPLETESQDYLVVMSEQLNNGNYCKEEYVVRFTSPFIVTLKDVELKTLLTGKDEKTLTELVTIVDRNGAKIYEKGKIIDNPYNLTDADIDFTDAFAIDLTDADGEFGDYLKVVDGNKIEWNNLGSVLQRDMTAKYTAQINVANVTKVKESAKVTVLSTEHSKVTE